MGLYAPKSKHDEDTIVYLGCAEDIECQQPGKVHGTLSSGEEVCSREQTRNILRMKLGDDYERSPLCSLALKQIEQEKLARKDDEADPELLRLTNEWNMLNIMARTDKEAQAVIEGTTAHEYISLNRDVQTTAGVSA